MKNVWDEIAESFDATRRFPWKECIDFIEEIEGICIDIGCGNGRHLPAMAEKCKIAVGVDYSFNMLKIAKEKVNGNTLLVCCDATQLPFHDETFDNAIFIASLHNIKERKNRIKALKEMRRILKKNGKALVSVWAKWQDKWRWHFLKEFFKPWKEHGDILIPWKKNGKEFMRFYHLYSMRELKKDVAEAGFEIEEAWSVKKATRKHADNHFLIVIKS
ncbi:ubiquinone/menaquinone biosynthesis protein [Thermoplasmatales archaeon ex4484_30]|nr:MAG: ubiquinone/menaquinone biosynthesis protein [Thermoplasmatales archaeon ex4484_30]